LGQKLGWSDDDIFLLNFRGIIVPSNGFIPARFWAEKIKVGVFFLIASGNEKSVLGLGRDYNVWVFGI
jgi:hypothetical protein